MKITKITEIMPGVYAHVCPLCEGIYASASEVDMMPEFSICDCDKNGNKEDVYSLYTSEERTMIRRNKYPRFIAEVATSGPSAMSNIVCLDDADALTLAKAMRKAGEFIIKNSRR